MPILEAHRALFIHIPRTGGTHLEDAMRLGGVWPHPDLKKLFGRYADQRGTYTLQHLTAEETVRLGFISAADYERLVKFAIVRDPYFRCLSLYHFWNDRPRMQQLLCGRVLAWPTFRDFVAHLQELDINEFLPDRDHTDVRYHCLPQYRYVQSPEGSSMIDLLLRFEDYTKDIGALYARIGFSEPPPPIDQAQEQKQRARFLESYNSELFADVGALYARDFEIFGYERRG